MTDPTTETPTADSALSQRAQQIPTTVLADLLADHGFGEQVIAPDITSVNAETPRIAGWAATVAGDVITEAVEGPDLLKARAIDAMPAGAIAVWSGGSAQDVCLFGDLLAHAMHVRGVRAAVVDGGVRDIDDIEAMGFPVWARYRTPRASTGVWRVHVDREPVTVRGTLGGTVVVHPGDLIVADVNGAVTIPAAAAEAVVAAGEAYVVRESEIRARIDALESLADLLTEYGRI